MNASYESIYGHHNTDPNDIPFLTVSDTAEYLGVSKSKIYKDIRNGKLAADRSLDDTTMVSPRALQHAYPELDIAALLDIDPIDNESEKQNNRPGYSLQSGVDSSIPSKKPCAQESHKPLPSSLELAIEKQTKAIQPTDEKTQGLPDNSATFEQPLEAPTHLGVDDKGEVAARPLAKRIHRALEFVAALTAASTILLVLLFNI